MGSTCGADADKSALRAEYLRARERTGAFGALNLDERILQRLRSLDVFASAGMVLLHVSLPGEVDTRTLAEELWAQGRRVAVPLGQLGELRFCEVSSWDDLEPDGLGGLVAKGSEADVLTPGQLVGSVCLVPGLVFDADGYRVGEDDGLYDRFLWYYPGEKIGLARSMELSSNPLPHGGQDVPVDVLVTDARVWHCR